MRFTFWQREISQHQSAQLRALARAPGVDVTIVAEQRVPDWRARLGWREPNLDGVEVVVAPDASRFARLTARTTGEDVHVISGLRRRTLPRQAFDRVRGTNALVGMMAESFNPLGAKGIVRRAVSRLAAKRFESAIGFVLAIGHTGMRWFRSAGYPESKLYAYGYFTESPADARPTHREDGGTRIVFIGNLIKRKGVDVLLRALATCRECDWRLTVVGDGTERGRLKTLAERVAVSDRIVWKGVCSTEQANELLSQSDTLVLPSRFDGWGAVVNEALMLGTPVVCTSACGAADLVRGNRGEVVPPEDVVELASSLRRRMGPLALTEREAIRAWSTAISGEAAAEYLLAIVRASRRDLDRPRPPWVAAG